MAKNQKRWSKVMQDLTELPKSHNVLGILNLSGEIITVGVDGDNDVWFQNEMMAEPHYMSVHDTKTLIALLQLGVKEATGEND